MPDIVDFSIPEGWLDLDEKKLKYLFGLMAQGRPSEEIKTLCLLLWSGTQVIGRQNHGHLLKQRNRLFKVTSTSIAELLSALDWIDDLPPVPVRLSRIDRRDALAADFQGVPFETYIICDNLYQGYLHTKDDGLLDQIAGVLYPGKKKLSLDATERVAVFYWMTSLKGFFSRRWPDFFQSSPVDTADLPEVFGNRLQEAMDAQIRALTKGDITREAEILAIDTWRALTELNTQAREYKQLKAATKR